MRHDYRLILFAEADKEEQINLDTNSECQACRKAKKILYQRKGLYKSYMIVYWDDEDEGWGIGRHVLSEADAKTHS